MPVQVVWWLGYLNRPWLILLGCLMVALLAGTYATQFRFDASSDTLVVQGDPDLALYTDVVETFGGDEFLFLTFKPDDGSPVSSESLARLDEMVTELSAIDGVRGVFSIFDAPLLKSPPMTLAEMLDGFRTLRSADVDLELAQEELANSPFFRELLVT